MGPPIFRLGRAPIRTNDNQIQRNVASWKDLKTRYVVMQKRDYSCGAAALATVIRYYWGDAMDEDTVLHEVETMLTPEELKDRVQEGLSITDLRRVSEKLGYDAAIGKMTMQKLYEVKVPVIVAIRTAGGMDHFVVVRGVFGDRVYLADPIRGNMRVLVDQFDREWIEGALLVVAKPGETKSDVSVLYVRANEVNPDYLNRQVLRTFPEHILSR